MEVKQDTLSIEFHVNAALERDQHENYHYVTPITGTVRGMLDDTLSEREVIAGRITGYRVHLTEAGEDPVDLFDIFDAYGDLEPYYHLLIDEGEMAFREEVLYEGFVEDDLMDVLIITDIWLTKYFRRQGLGERMVERFIEFYAGGCRMAVLDIRPGRDSAKLDPMFRRDMALHLFEQDPEQARKKLTAYWERLGFEHLAGTNVMTLLFLK